MLLCMFTLSGMCDVCLLVHGAVADKNYVCTLNLVLLCHSLFPLKILGYILKLMQIDLVYDL
jgi:hypothetical protein